MLSTKKQRFEMGNFSDLFCCSDTSVSTGKSLYIKDQMAYSRNGASILSRYRASYASVSAITVSESFSSIIDHDEDDDAMMLEQARKEVTVISPVMLKYNRSSSLKIRNDELDNDDSLPCKNSKSNSTPSSLKIPDDDMDIKEPLHHNNKTPKITESITTMSRERLVSGPNCGTFENASTDNQIMELNHTYVRFRMDENIARILMTRMNCSVPPFHTRNSDSYGSRIADMCSEPLASNFQVRGPTYLQDGEKIPSNEAIFALLGCDSIVRRKNDNNELKVNLSSRPDSFVGRFQTICHEIGFQAPFLYVSICKITIVIISLFTQSSSCVSWIAGWS